MNTEYSDYQVTELFPTAVIGCDASEYITDLLKKKVDNICKNMSEEIACCEAVWSKDTMNDIFGLSKFEDLKEFITKQVIKKVADTYSLENLQARGSFGVRVPKGGYIQVQKSLNCNFNLLINFSSSTQILLTNPHSYLQSNFFKTVYPSKYNSQYGFLPFEENSVLVIPSSVHFGFCKVEKDLTFINVTLA